MSRAYLLFSNSRGIDDFDEIEEQFKPKRRARVPIRPFDSQARPWGKHLQGLNRVGNLSWRAKDRRRPGAYIAAEEPEVIGIVDVELEIEALRQRRTRVRDLPELKGIEDQREIADSDDG